MTFKINARDRKAFVAYLMDLDDAIRNDEPGPFLTFKEYQREEERRARLKKRDPGGDINIGG